jgi:hypothetical protein
MYEHRKQPLLSRAKFTKRVIRHFTGEGIPIENIEKELLRWLDEKPETLTTSLGSGTF